MLSRHFPKPALLAFIITALSFGQITPALSAANDETRQRLVADLKTANYNSKLTMIANGRFDGSAFITIVNQKAAAVVIYSEAMKCVALSMKANDIELACLDGDRFTGTMSNLQSTTRLSGEFEKFGDAKIILRDFQPGGFEDVLGKASGGEYEWLNNFANSLAVARPAATEAVAPVVEAPKVVEPVVEAPKIVEPVVAAKAEQSQLATLISNAEELCVDLGFENGSDKLSTCVLKILKKSE